MAGMCRGVNIGGETETAKPVEPTSQSARRRRMEIHQFRFVASDVALESGRKRQKLKADVPGRACGNAVQNSVADGSKLAGIEQQGDSKSSGFISSFSSSGIETGLLLEAPKFGMTSVCGRRRDMEDAVSIHPSFSSGSPETSSNLHFYGVFDGHGCSHVRTLSHYSTPLSNLVVFNYLFPLSGRLCSCMLC